MSYFLVYEASVFAVFLSLRVHIAYRFLFFSAHPHILPLLLAALTTSIMNVEDTELFLAPHSASKSWRGRCMWVFEDSGGPALRYGEGVDLISERFVRVKFKALPSVDKGRVILALSTALHRLSYTHTSLTRSSQLA
jgi:hypothetical protein